MSIPEISRIIKERREELDMSLEDVGKKLGLNRSTVFRWEKGYTKDIKRAQIYLLSQILYLPVETLLGAAENTTIEDAEIVKARLKIIDKINLIKDKNKIEEINNFIEFVNSKKIRSFRGKKFHKT